MWKLSGGGDAQHCFHRVRQYEYYLDESGYEALAHMPNVSPGRFGLFHFDNSVFLYFSFVA